MHWRAAKFQQSHPRGIRCTLCPFSCLLGDGDVGRCNVRRRRGSELETATFATSVRHIHPIERKPFYHFLPGTRVLTLAAPGCTFRCTYCQNYRISQFGRDRNAAWTATPLGDSIDDIIRAARAADAGIAFSYSEPILSSELTLTLAPRARRAGLPVVWKSNGFVTPEAAEELAGAIDAVNVDLKTVDDDAHRQLTGAPVHPVLAAIRTWAKRGVWIELSTPLIPGFNTSPESLRAMATTICSLTELGPDIPWHLVRFHPDYRLLHSPPTHPDLLRQARTIAADEGLRHVYIERALGECGRNTFCPKCNALVVRRAIWALKRQFLDTAACRQCKTPIPGRWNTP